MKNYSSNEILEILKRHKELLKRYKVKRIGLFGSFLGNESNNESDIDLLVDFEEKSLDNFIDLVFELEEIFDRKVDLLTEKGISPYILPYVQNEVRWYEA
ncbi:MAG: nucleotidyltransferase family protein [Ignavibacteriales bacterium]|nr:nucleotidyltransferase family protein [Ignavibacteriales bacterium]